MLQKVLAVSGAREVKLLYDVGCKLRPQLEASGVAMEQVTLAVPLFHGYSHDAGCQVFPIIYLL